MCPDVFANRKGSEPLHDVGASESEFLIVNISLTPRMGLLITKGAQKCKR